MLEIKKMRHFNNNKKKKYYQFYFFNLIKIVNLKRIKNTHLSIMY